MAKEFIIHLSDGTTKTVVGLERFFVCYTAYGSAHYFALAFQDSVWRQCKICESDNRKELEALKERLDRAYARGDNEIWL
ncbi:MAG: hypothetical protein IJ217_05590 [Clostridia bacterium]|nr:hypothetical protein [Clostridia bacterium]